jgi:hypothetical protein
MSNRTPSNCHHTGSGQTVVRIDGKDHYLGKFDSEESRKEYDRLISKSSGTHVPPPCSHRLARRRRGFFVQ